MIEPFKSGSILDYQIQQFAEHHEIELISGSEQSLLAVVVQKRLQVVLPDESVAGEPFYCLMELGNEKQITGTYIRTFVTEENSFLILCVSKKEAEDLVSDSNTVVRGIDKRHLEILCNYSAELGWNLAIKIFLEPKIQTVEPQLIREYFL
ncbi:hypothetical protein [Bacillus sp. J14TS2]|uniref:hypothetical protein n=1 Tax=Bacillus sp. J14TS2 TaxID=2807188 RepID=UPI001BB36018|nr:hypothetical protein [Bacillus sp. J14TS2]